LSVKVVPPDLVCSIRIFVLFRCSGLSTQDLHVAVAVAVKVNVNG
jgi:hypothetical protein